jgi:uncharacterized protein YceK
MRSLANPVLAALFLSLLPIGCGTTMNCADKDDVKLQKAVNSPHNWVYGGVQWDALFIRDGIVATATEPSEYPGQKLENTGLILLAVIDIPLSFVFDTLTLPTTVKAAVEKRPERSQATVDSTRAVLSTPARLPGTPAP